MEVQTDLLKRYHFKTFPFPVSPVEEATLWADLKKIKDELSQFLTFTFSVPASISALLWGWRGAGKTYAMNYFQKIEKIKEMIEEKKLTVVVIRLPFQIIIGRESYKALHKGIIDNLRQNLKEIFANISSESKRELQPIGSLAKTFKEELKMFTPNEIIINNIADWFESIIYDRVEIENEKLETLKLKNKILAEDDIQQIDSTLFNFLANSETIRKYVNGKHIRIVLWLDEWECITDISTMERLKINDFLRYIIDYVPSYLTLLINVTLKPDEESNDIPNYFTFQLLDRINKRIEFPPLTENDAFQYIYDRLKLNKEDKKDEISPFIETSIKEAIKILSDTEKPLLPRNLNRVFSILLFDAYFKNKDVIDEEFIKKEEERIKSFL